jgi:hypothetical protein
MEIGSVDIVGVLGRYEAAVDLSECRRRRPWSQIFVFTFYGMGSTPLTIIVVLYIQNE